MSAPVKMESYYPFNTTTTPMALPADTNALVTAGAKVVSQADGIVYGTWYPVSGAPANLGFTRLVEQSYAIWAPSNTVIREVVNFGPTFIAVDVDASLLSANLKISTSSDAHDIPLTPVIAEGSIGVVPTPKSALASNIPYPYTQWAEHMTITKINTVKSAFSSRVNVNYSGNFTAPAGFKGIPQWLSYFNVTKPSDLNGKIKLIAAYELNDAPAWDATPADAQNQTAAWKAWIATLLDLNAHPLTTEYPPTMESELIKRTPIDLPTWTAECHSSKGEYFFNDYITVPISGIYCASAVSEPVTVKCAETDADFHTYSSVMDNLAPDDFHSKNWYVDSAEKNEVPDGYNEVVKIPKAFFDPTKSECQTLTEANSEDFWVFDPFIVAASFIPFNLDMVPINLQTDKPKPITGPMFNIINPKKYVWRPTGVVTADGTSVSDSQPFIAPFTTSDALYLSVNAKTTDQTALANSKGAYLDFETTNANVEGLGHNHGFTQTFEYTIAEGVTLPTLTAPACVHAIVGMKFIQTANEWRMIVNLGMAFVGIIVEASQIDADTLQSTVYDGFPIYDIVSLPFTKRSEYAGKMTGFKHNGVVTTFNAGGHQAPAASLWAQWMSYLNVPTFDPSKFKLLKNADESSSFYYTDATKLKKWVNGTSTIDSTVFTDATVVALKLAPSETGYPFHYLCPTKIQVIGTYPATDHFNEVPKNLLMCDSKVPVTSNYTVKKCEAATIKYNETLDTANSIYKNPRTTLWDEDVVVPSQFADATTGACVTGFDKAAMTKFRKNDSTAGFVKAYYADFLPKFNYDFIKQSAVHATDKKFNHKNAIEDITVTSTTAVKTNKSLKRSQEPYKHAKLYAKVHTTERKLVHYCYRLEKTNRNTYRLYVCHGTKVKVYEVEKSLVDETVVPVADMPASKKVPIDLSTLPPGAWQITVETTLYGTKLGNLVPHWLACLNISKLTDLNGKIGLVTEFGATEKPMQAIKAFDMSKYKVTVRMPKTVKLTLGEQEYDTSPL